MARRDPNCRCEGATPCARSGSGKTGGRPSGRRRGSRVFARRRDRPAVGGARPCVAVDLRRVLDAICEHAREGYCEPYKREVIGILLGRARRTGAISCLRAVPYATPFRTRTRCDPHPGALWRRAAALAREHGLDFLGYYHSHPEEAHSRAHALSKEDREVFFRDRRARIEVVVSVDRAGKRARVPAENPCVNRDGSLSFWREGFYFRISAEAKEPARAGCPRSHAQ